MGCDSPGQFQVLETLHPHSSTISVPDSLPVLSFFIGAQKAYYPLLSSLLPVRQEVVWPQRVCLMQETDLTKFLVGGPRDGKEVGGL